MRSCLLAARTNARSVRTALTIDMWESINSAWLEFSQLKPREVTGGRLQELLQWIKQVSHQYRGALLSTILRDDGYAFSQIGNFVERADNTARILDMKYYVLLPSATLVGGDIDIQQWTLILRAASAHRSYRHVYHDRYKAWNIADYLILRSEMPRSLIFCVNWINRTLDMLEQIYGGRTAGHDAVAGVAAMLEGNDMDRVFAYGLHEFLTEFIARNNRITEALSESYNFY
ncbi:MAG: alpha-E domain-containing protein [Devosia sp.]